MHVDYKVTEGLRGGPVVRHVPVATPGRVVTEWYQSLVSKEARPVGLCVPLGHSAFTGARCS